MTFSVRGLVPGFSIFVIATVACSAASNRSESEDVFTVVAEPFGDAKSLAIATELAATTGPLAVATLPGPRAVGVPPTSTPGTGSTGEETPAITAFPKNTGTDVPTPTAVIYTAPKPETSSPTPAPSGGTSTVPIVSTLFSSPTPIPLPTATTTPTVAALQPLATLTPPILPLPTFTPVPTVGSFPTATPPPTSTPLPIATSTPDPRYGVVLSSDTAHLADLGISTYLTFSADMSNVPAGTQRLIFIKSVNPVRVAEINAAAQSKPGSIWYVLGEPNAHGVQPADVVVGLHDTYEAIIAADSTAKITSPSLLNFDYTCDSTCGGYESGRSWAERFLDAYSDLYGESPPIDYWAFDGYPIRWDAVNPLTVDSSIVKNDLVSLRSFLDSRPGESGKPILVTELGIHWGFSAVTFSKPGCGWFPSGTYQEQQVENYFSDVFSWLETNSHQLNIERWFVFSTYLDMSVCRADGGYGLTMFESDGPGADLSPFGIYFRDWVRGVRP